MADKYEFGTIEYKVFKTFTALKKQIKPGIFNNELCNMVMENQARLSLLYFSLYFEDDINRMGLNLEAETKEPELVKA